MDSIYTMRRDLCRWCLFKILVEMVDRMQRCQVGGQNRGIIVLIITIIVVLGEGEMDKKTTKKKS